jgi:hypothetical protein
VRAPAALMRSRYTIVTNALTHCAGAAVAKPQAA